LRTSNNVESEGDAGARREDLLEPQRAQRTQRKMNMAHTRSQKSVPFGKDLQISSTATPKNPTEFN
jgi:hypothetical protein